jgi:hypothetical protein
MSCRARQQKAQGRVGQQNELNRQARIDRNIRALQMCKKRMIQDSNHESELCKRVSKNKRYLLCFGLIRKLLTFLPVRNNENTI